MYYSQKKNFMFVHIPKTGGQAVKHQLVPYVAIDKSVTYPCHISAQRLQEEFDDFNILYKFGFVRNPWDRIVSWYHFSKNRIALPAIFKDFIELMEQGAVYRPLMMTEMLCDKDGKLLVDFVGRYETLQEDFNKVCVDIGIDTRKLHLVNPSKHKPYQECYTPALVESVRRLYQKDIETFKYSFE